MATTLRINSTYAADPVQITLWVTDCPNCAVVFGIPKAMKDQRRKDGETLYCPNGHPMAWEKTEADKLREQLLETQKECQYAWQVYEEADADRKRTAATLRVARGHLTRLKKRAEAGVCIHCNRTFQDVARHMQSKHGQGNPEQGAN